MLWLSIVILNAPLLFSWLSLFSISSTTLFCNCARLNNQHCPHLRRWKMENFLPLYLDPNFGLACGQVRPQHWELRNIWFAMLDPRFHHLSLCISLILWEIWLYLLLFAHNHLIWINFSFFRYFCPNLRKSVVNHLQWARNNVLAEEEVRGVGQEPNGLRNEVKRSCTGSCAYVYDHVKFLLWL